MNELLQLCGLVKQYATHRAVDGVDLAIHGGEFFSLVGPSGCGKTTTLRLIGGFETATSGDILLQGRSLNWLKPYQREVTTVFQNYALFPHLTVAENVAFGLEQRQLPRREVKSKVEEALALVQLSGKEKRLPAQISGGERQRVALARSLAVRPKLLLLDEPLSALDPNLRKQVRQELKTLQQHVGITFLFITHDQEEALSLSDRMAVMHAGRLEQTGTPRELYHRPTSLFVAEFLGEVNCLGGTWLRPESLRVACGRPPEAVRSLAGVVEGTTFLGNRTQVWTRLATGEMCVAEIPSAEEQRFCAGDALYIWWHPADELTLP